MGRSLRTAALPSACACVALLSGCVAASGPSPDVVTASVAPITVTRAAIAPTLSVPGHVIASPTILVQSATSGVFRALARPGEAVTRGQTLATVGGVPVASPADGTIAAVAVADGSEIPGGLPLVELTYAGFALKGDVAATLAAWAAPGAATARGQLDHGPAPFDCIAFVGASGDAEGRVSRLCLVPKNVPATLGNLGIFVARGELVADAVVVPIGAVAGRTGSGTVVLIEDGRRREVPVTLGVSDGVRIEVVSGLTPGQLISPVAPNLDKKVGR